MCWKGMIKRMGRWAAGRLSSFWASRRPDKTAGRAQSPGWAGGVCRQTKGVLPVGLRPDKGRLTGRRQQCAVCSILGVHPHVEVFLGSRALFPGPPKDLCYPVSCRCVMPPTRA